MNKKLASFLCDPKKAAKNVFLFLLMIFLVIYAGFQILPSFSQKIEIENAMHVSLYDSIHTNGYIFRDEVVIRGDSSGIPVTLIKDGDRLSKGQHFANVYSTKDYADLQKEVNAIDDKIEVLEKSVIELNAYVTDITKTDKEINDYFEGIFKEVSEGNLNDISSIEDSLLVSLNKRELIVSMTKGYEAEIAKLRTERSYLESRINAVSKKLVAQSAGYYYGDTDGYENEFTMDALENLTFESFKELSHASENAEVKENSYGKIVNSFVWYVVCEAEKDSVAAYRENAYYSLAFPAFSEDPVKMELQKIIKSTSEKTALLVFRGNTAPEGFTYQRNQQVDIITNQYSGLAVPKEAVRVVNGIRGVYILNGDIVRFRRIEIIFEDDGYYITTLEKPQTDTEPDEQTDDAVLPPYLALYDSVIVKGKNLFDGKIIA